MSTLSVHDHGVAHHEEGHEHHHDTFLTKYIFSQDHKMIAKQFLITGITMAVIAMLLSILFRIQLAYPDKAFPLLETLLGRFAPEGRLDPEFYLSLVTIHGTIMVFFVLTAGLCGYGFAIHQYVIILVFLNRLYYHVILFLHTKRPCRTGMDNLSATVCIANCHERFRPGYDIMVN
jgi:hypothetical protein